MFNAPLHISKMIKSLITACIFRSFIFRNLCIKFYCKTWCVDHLVFCLTRMHTLSSKFNYSRCSIKIFIFEFTNSASVYCISIFCTETLNVKVVHSSANFLIRCKCYIYVRVLNLRIIKKIFRHCHNLCNACFIICPKKCFTVSCNQIFSNIVF